MTKRKTYSDEFRAKDSLTEDHTGPEFSKQVTTEPEEESTTENPSEEKAPPPPTLN